MDESQYDWDMLTESGPASKSLTSTSPVGTSKQLKEAPNSGPLSVFLSAVFFLWLIVLCADCAAKPVDAQTNCLNQDPTESVNLLGQAEHKPKLAELRAFIMAESP